MTTNQQNPAAGTLPAAPADRSIPNRVYLLATFLGDLAKALKSMAAQDTTSGTRPDGRPLMLPGDRDVITVQGRTLGKVTMTKGRTTVRVDTTHPQFIAWVKENHPEHIVETVAPAFVELLKKQVAERGGPVDETTGEIIPGVTITHGDPGLTRRLEPEIQKALEDPQRIRAVYEVLAADDTAILPMLPPADTREVSR